MSTQTDRAPDADRDEDRLAGPPRRRSRVSSLGLDVLAEQLVAQARNEGISLTGPGGLLTGFTSRVLETPLETELTEHLGHEHGEPPAGSNVRNGYSAKTVRTDVGDVQRRVPRDLAGTFDPVMVPKQARRLAGFDERVISLSAKGMTTGDIANHLQDVYGTQVSRDLVSRVIDAVVADMASGPTGRSIRSTRSC
jgi:putative transposase